MGEEHESLVPADSDLQRLLEPHLTREELERGVVYVLSRTVMAGETLAFAHLTIPVPWDAVVAFVDREPSANWGHSSRYLLLHRATGETLSIEARFPPFQRHDAHLWGIVHRAPSVGDAFVQSPDGDGNRK